jgi:hypothetical protein
MATSIPLNASAPVRPAVAHPVRILLRLEGLAVAAVAIAIYARVGQGWALFAALWFVPDLALLAYLRSADFGSRVYNVVHSYVTPATLGLVGFLLHGHLAVAAALIWASHIGIDRMFGYGLKHADNFESTHLGRIGRKHSL